MAADGAAGGGQIVEPHFGIFSGEDHTVGVTLKGADSGLVGVVGRGFSAVNAGWYVDVDSRENTAFAFYAGYRALGFAEYIVGGEAGCGEVFDGGFIGVVEEVVVHLHELAGRDVAEDGLANVVDEIDVAFTAAVVIYYHLEEVGEFGQLRIVTGGAIEGVEGVGVFYVEADLEVVADGFYRCIYVF